jgi:hypothetical protein
VLYHSVKPPKICPSKNCAPVSVVKGWKYLTIKQKTVDFGVGKLYSMSKFTFCNMSEVGIMGRYRSLGCARFRVITYKTGT